MIDIAQAPRLTKQFGAATFGLNPLGFSLDYAAPGQLLFDTLGYFTESNAVGSLDSLVQLDTGAGTFAEVLHSEIPFADFWKRWKFDTAAPYGFSGIYVSLTAARPNGADSSMGFSNMDVRRPKNRIAPFVFSNGHRVGVPVATGRASEATTIDPLNVDA